jgi:hypothetical protein
MARYRVNPFGWFRRRHRRTTPRSLVFFPAFRECPADVRRELHRLAPDLEIIYLGVGEWWLGRVLPSWDRYVRGAAAAKTALYFESTIDVGKHKQGLLAMQGFAWISSFYGEPDGNILNFAQFIRWQKETQDLDKPFEENLYLSDDERKLDRAKAYIDAKNEGEGREIWRHAFKRPKTFSGKFLGQFRKQGQNVRFGS